MTERDGEGGLESVAEGAVPAGDQRQPAPEASQHRQAEQPRWPQADQSAPTPGGQPSWQGYGPGYGQYPPSGWLSSPPPPGYAPTAWGQPPAPPMPRTDRKAVGALALAAFAYLVAGLFGLGFIFTVTALVLTYLSREDIKASRGMLRGDSLNKVAIVLSVVWLALYVFGWIFGRLFG